MRSSKRLIAASSLVRDAKDEATASLLVFNALATLAEAAGTLHRMVRLAALTPELASDAPVLLQRLNVAWIEVTDELIVSALDFRQPPDLEEKLRAITLPDVRLIARRPLNPVRLFLAEEVSRAAMRRFLAGPRRRRFVPSRIADAPRRVSRGRAPPALALCPL